MAKVIPDDETLAQAYRRADRIHRLNAMIRELLENSEELEATDAPEDLHERVEQYLADNPSASWDEALGEIAEERVGEAA